LLAVLAVLTTTACGVTGWRPGWGTVYFLLFVLLTVALLVALKRLNDTAFEERRFSNLSSRAAVGTIALLLLLAIAFVMTRVELKPAVVVTQSPIPPAVKLPAPVTPSKPVIIADNAIAQFTVKEKREVYQKFNEHRADINTVRDRFQTFKDQQHQINVRVDSELASLKPKAPQAAAKPAVVRVAPRTQAPARRETAYYLCVVEGKAIFSTVPFGNMCPTVK
jgi:hypothetical protein